MGTGKELTTLGKSGLVIRASQERLDEMQAVADDCCGQLIKAENKFRASLVVAAAIRRLHELITDEMMQDIVGLQGLGCGFRTDRDPTGKVGQAQAPYGVDVVRTVFIEAAARGFYPHNNEFNIISGRFYGAQAGFVRLVKQFPGLSHLHVHYGKIEVKGDNAYQDVVAEWLVDGQPDKLEFVRKKRPDGSEFDERLVVRNNEKMQLSAVEGKTIRKVHKAIYERLTRNVIDIPDGEVDDDVTPAAEEGRKVAQSGLFSDEPVEPAPEQHDQGELVEEYERDLAECTEKNHVSTVAKRAGGDGRLTDKTRREIAGKCSDRRKEL